MEILLGKYPDFQIILRWCLPSNWSGSSNESCDSWRYQHCPWLQ